eukprot:CAMPEP_0178675576 /NCGR_PEP_ID=MMETSP0698-20121128/35456_1 /TAXON_ID=265572 /ORGANISM="Extubocellulus spinifer, Strain CCMP396" /LENGTH=144 /DNA_ID=CAMNT_0020319757 /DNA_START=178 /DNA_END=609 /DNA_ORIENTATION=+
MTVRPMKKKAVQTPGTVRDFALLQISMSTTADTSFAAAGEQKQGVVPSKDAGNECTVVDEVLAAFRLAAHHAILYMDQTFGSEGKSSKLADKKQKTADFARRALMTCFVSHKLIPKKATVAANQVLFVRYLGKGLKEKEMRQVL